MRNLCLALLAACGGAHADGSNIQIYGRLNVGLESMRGDDVRVSRLSNYRSVLGFRGSEDLGGGLKAIFQIEGTLAPDTGAGSPAARDTRLGLEGKFGTIFAGNWTTPYNGATAGLDPFYPTTAGYMSIMGNGSAATVSSKYRDPAAYRGREDARGHHFARRKADRLYPDGRRRTLDLDQTDRNQQRYPGREARRTR